MKKIKNKFLLYTYSYLRNYLHTKFYELFFYPLLKTIIKKFYLILVIITTTNLLSSERTIRSWKISLGIDLLFSDWRYIEINRSIYKNNRISLLLSSPFFFPLVYSTESKAVMCLGYNRIFKRYKGIYFDIDIFLGKMIRSLEVGETTDPRKEQFMMFRHYLKFNFGINYSLSSVISVRQILSINYEFQKTPVISFGTLLNLHFGKEK